MRVTILRMLSTNSLSAFSASVTQAGIGRGAAAANVGPITRVRSPAGPDQPQAPSTPPRIVLPEGATAPPTGRAMPRGSLLDLSV